MNPIRAIAVVCIAVATAGTALAQKDDCKGIGRGVPYVPNRLLVQPKDEQKFRAELASRWKTLRDRPLTINEIADTGWFTIDSPVASMDAIYFNVIRPDLDEFLNFASDDAIVGHQNPPPESNDEEFTIDVTTMWGIRAIRAPDAWKFGTGSRDVFTAIVDSGIKRTHEDLLHNIWKIETPFVLNGYRFIADCHGDDFGYDAIDGDCRPDVVKNPHGTHVSGIIGALGGNGLSIVGVNWLATLLPIAILNEDNVSCISRAAKGLEFVWRVKEKKIAPVRVVNLSWGTKENSPLIRQELEKLADADVVIVASAGNDECGPALYPAAYTHIKTLISVGATREDGLITDITNCGPSVLIGAPGERIRTTHPDPVVDDAGGTSMAAAFVSGAAALLASQCSDLTAVELRNLILECADRKPELDPLVAEGRFLNVMAAAEQCATRTKHRKLEASVDAHSNPPDATVHHAPQP